MNKKDLIAVVAHRANITKKQAALIVSTVQDVMTETLASGESVQISGFGAFEVKNRAPRLGRNPVTKEPKEVPAHRAVAFRAGKYLKESVAASPIPED